MKAKRALKLAAALLLLSTLNSALSTGFAQGTAFTYQGRLNDGANAATGNYDLTFTLFSVGSGGSAVAGPLTNSPTGVTNGLFTATLDFGASFPGAGRWLEIAVRTNGGGAFTNLSPRLKITPTPYAITASNLTGTLPVTQLSGTLSSAQLGGTYSSAVILNNAGNSFTGNGSGLTSLNLSGTYSSAVTFNNAGNSFSGNGFGLSGVNAATLNGFGSSSFWKTVGNSGTSPGSGNFVGTTDNQPLELDVFGQRAFRLEPDATAPNVIGGHPNNYSGGFSGVTIAGGGGLLNSNQALGNFSAIGGGSGNQAGEYATVSGGTNNLATGIYSVISGGFVNVAGPEATVSGGASNSASGLFSTIAGGYHNSAVAPQTVVSGGTSNRALGLLSVVSGGGTNLALGTSSAVGGGVLNQATSFFATVSGGSNNLASGYASTVSGGEANQATLLDATVGGGIGNISKAPYTTVGGGYFNLAAVQGDTVGGGAVNTAAGGYATVGGGLQNLATNLYATIGGGLANVAGATNSTVGGGATNKATGLYSTIPGGREASATQYGQLANASGAFAAPGDAQHSIFILRATTAGFSTSTNLTLDGGTNSNYLVISTNRTMTFHILLSARVDPSSFPLASDSAGFEVKGVVKESGGGITFVGGPPPTFTSLGQDTFAWSTPTLSTIGNALIITVSTGGGYPFPVRWVARVDTAEVAW